MIKQARIVDDVAVDVVTGDPAEMFHPDIASQFEVIPDEIENGWWRDPTTGEWSAPEPAEEQPATAPDAPKVSPVEFKLLFSPQERVAIKAARGTDPVIADFFDIVEDPRLTFVDFGLQSTKDAIAYLASKDLLTEARAAEVLSGVLK
jgi:hypothetical protein